MKFTKEKEQSIINDYLAGLNTVEIANKWNTYNTSIRRVLLRYNIPLRGNKDRSKALPNPFKLGDEYSEYFLGMLLTDGCITRRHNRSAEINLTLKDLDIVEKFRDFTCPANKITAHNTKYNTTLYSINVSSDSIAEWLDSKGNFINKSNNCDIYIPITPHILRGIFDGDGYWHTTNKGHTRQWGVCGKSLIFLQKIQEYLTSLGISSHLRKSPRPNNSYLYYLEVTKTVDVVKIANLMYKEASIYLMRKYDSWHLFEEILKVKFAKFKEREASPNPEPNHNNGQFIMEGAETIMRYLNL